MQLQQVTYGYDAFNRLVTRSVRIGQGAVQTGYFVYDGLQMTLVLNDQAAVEHRILWRPAVDQALADENAAGDVYFFLTDNQGTVRDIAEYDSGTDTTTIANHIVYDSFGREVSETDDTLDVLDLPLHGPLAGSGHRFTVEPAPLV